jgi:hypothetical protein
VHSLALSEVGYYVAVGLIKQIPRVGWQCTQCGKTHKHKYNIARHVDAKHVMGQYACPLCEHVTKTEDARQNHLKRIHKMILSCKEIRSMEK